ncbi:hypothetical protein KM043_011628 [Ampulex compressa]|nr:hypothetical protein KM043_011628 [Ampulex compressa]
MNNRRQRRRSEWIPLKAYHDHPRLTRFRSGLELGFPDLTVELAEVHFELGSYLRDVNSGRDYGLLAWIRGVWLFSTAVTWRSVQIPSYSLLSLSGHHGTSVRQLAETEGQPEGRVEGDDFPETRFPSHPALRSFLLPI